MGGYKCGGVKCVVWCVWCGSVCGVGVSVGGVGVSVRG